MSVGVRRQVNNHGAESAELKWLIGTSRYSVNEVMEALRREFEAVDASDVTAASLCIENGVTESLSWGDEDSYANAPC